MKNEKFKIYKPFIIAFLILFVFSAILYLFHQSRFLTVREEFLLLGTIVDIQIPCPPGKREKAYEAIQEAQKEISRLEVLMSPYKAESDISRINAGAAREPTQVSRETFDTINKAIAFSRITNGAFDISFLPVGKLWRLDRDNPGIPAKEEIQDKLPLVNYENIRMHEGERKISFTREGMEIGLGGIAKGTAVDWAVKVIKKAGFSDALVNAGGDIYALGLNADRKPWRIGVLHPRDKSRFIARIDISNRAVVTSGDYERMIEVNGKRYHHILDPQTGYPSEKSMSVTVLAEDAETADALSTGLFVLGAEKGMEILKNIKGVDALFVTSEGDIFATPFFNIPQGKTLESIDHKSNKR